MVFGCFCRFCGGEALCDVSESGHLTVSCPGCCANYLVGPFGASKEDD